MRTVDEQLFREGLARQQSHLAHYGVKGMKWGVRRTEKELKAARKLQKFAAKDAKRSRSAFTDGVLERQAKERSTVANNRREREKSGEYKQIREAAQAKADQKIAEAKGRRGGRIAGTLARDQAVREARGRTAKAAQKLNKLDFEAAYGKTPAAREAAAKKLKAEAARILKSPDADLGARSTIMPLFFSATPTLVVKAANVSRSRSVLDTAWDIDNTPLSDLSRDRSND